MQTDGYHTDEMPPHPPGGWTGKLRKLKHLRNTTGYENPGGIGYWFGHGEIFMVLSDTEVHNDETWVRFYAFKGGKSQVLMRDLDTFLLNTETV